MPLSSVASLLEVAAPTDDPMIEDVHHDSRRAAPASLFVAIRGADHDGHDFVDDAVANGAVAVITERPTDAEVPQLVVGDTRRALATAAAMVHGHPSRSMAVIGVTGTNGKTTVTHMVEAIGRAAGRSTGIVGTLGARVGGVDIALERTTPESSDLQRLLRRMAGANAELVAMEVSSHALALRRVDEVHFALGAFTNLSQDHLDFHGDMESYFAAKTRLFEAGRAAAGVVNVDDPWGKRLADGSGIPITTVGSSPGDDVRISHADARGGGCRFVVGWRGSEASLTLPLPGRFNIDNAAVAAAACLELGVDFADVRTGLENVPQVPGRFEAVPGGWPFHVIVDYAHTPEAVSRVVEAAREISPGRVIALLGAGGDRDADKRPLMGAAAAQADVAVITSDNPRSEDPASIVEAVATGAGGGSGTITEVDRRTAIGLALGLAQPGDFVLVLGKGHEQGQEFEGGRVEPFDDRSVVLEERWTGPGGAGP